MKNIQRHLPFSLRFSARLVFLTLSSMTLAIMQLTTGCSQAAGTSITIKGSDTMVRLGQRWAEEYMHGHPEIVIQVSGGGSGTGFSALINGTTDIAQGSRDIKPDEIELLKKKGHDVNRFTMSLDGIAIYLNKENPITELTLDQLRKMYIGEITNWKQVGGNDGKIVLYSRENNSGTYAYFKEVVLKEADFTSWTLSLPGTSAVVNAVSQDPLGIGYGGIAWATGVKTCKVKVNDTSVAYAPEVELISKGIYPISRSLYWFTAVPPTGAIHDFLNWALSKEGQKIAEEASYVPLHPDDAARQILK